MYGKINKGQNTLFLTLLSVLIIFIAFIYTGYQIYMGHRYLEKVCVTIDAIGNLVNAFSVDNKGNFLVIDKKTKRLIIYDDHIKTKSYSITIGKEPGNKKAPGDNRTPEGIFLVKSVDNSINWQYNYKNDTTAPTIGAYGPWFIRLCVPGFNGIGIHGFYHDEALGKRASHGCIRLNNEHLKDLVNFVKQGMPVVILPGEKDLVINNGLMK